MQQQRAEYFGAILAGCLTLLAPAGAAEAAETPILTGQGNHTYEWVRNWIKLPPGVYVGRTHGDVVIDSKDRIFFSTDTGAAIYQVDTDGRVQKAFGHVFENGAHGLRLVRDKGQEVIWITHLNRHEVIKIALDGTILQTITAPLKIGVYKDAKEFVPTAVDVAPNGDVYVADGYGRNWVHRFNAAGDLLQSWNGVDGRAGPFNTPHGVGIDLRGADPRVVVADRSNHRLQLFTLDGKYVDMVLEDLRAPSKIVIKGDDMMIIDLEGRVSVFDRQYKVIAQIGDNPDRTVRGGFAIAPDRWQDGRFISPHGAAWDSQGNLYVEDWNTFGRVSKLKRVKARAAKP